MKQECSQTLDAPKPPPKQDPCAWIGWAQGLLLLSKPRELCDKIVGGSNDIEEFNCLVWTAGGKSAPVVVQLGVVLSGEKNQ
jgi:hypothetical protein